MLCTLTTLVRAARHGTPLPALLTEDGIVVAIDNPDAAPYGNVLHRHRRALGHPDIVEPVGLASMLRGRRIRASRSWQALSWCPLCFDFPASRDAAVEDLAEVLHELYRTVLAPLEKLRSGEPADTRWYAALFEALTVLRADQHPRLTPNPCITEADKTALSSWISQLAARASDELAAVHEQVRASIAWLDSTDAPAAVYVRITIGGPQGQLARDIIASRPPLALLTTTANGVQRPHGVYALTIREWATVLPVLNSGHAAELHPFGQAVPGDSTDTWGVFTQLWRHRDPQLRNDAGVLADARAVLTPAA